MATITFPENTRDTINAIRGVIGRDVTFYTIASTSGCSGCSLDPVNNASTDPFCFTCSGNYWIITYDETTVTGHVRWFPFEEPTFTTAGLVHDGDCVVTIEHTTGLMNLVENTKFTDVDGIRMLIHRYVLRGKPEINRIRLLLKEES